jgi:hypothetical protein
MGFGGRNLMALVVATLCSCALSLPIAGRIAAAPEVEDLEAITIIFAGLDGKIRGRDGTFSE